MRKALTFDDVQIVPRYSELKSREKVNLDSKFTPNTTLSIPLVASPMDTICEYKMASEMLDTGGVGVIHRFQSIEKQAEQMKRVWRQWNSWYDIGGDTDRTDHNRIFDEWYKGIYHWNSPPTKTDYEDLHELLWFADEAKKDEGYWSKRPLCAAVGVTGDYLERAQELVNNGCNVLLIDVAHGHHKSVKEALRRINNEIKSTRTLETVVGSIATKESARDCIEWGASALRVGIGNGSLCETRIRTGVGIPQVTAITDVHSVSDNAGIPIIADGGCRYVGDVAKSLALGASSVMVGSLFAGTKETPGEIIKQGEWPNERLYKKYRGSASLDSKSDRREYGNVEGNSKIIEYKGKVHRIVSDIRDGVRSAFSYVGADNLLDFQSKAKFVEITESGRIEARPHLL
jgi:IMP dehydrogenase